MSFGGIVKNVNLAYVPEVKVGEYVNVHVGFALSVIDEAEAMRVFEYLDEIEAIEAVFDAAGAKVASPGDERR